MINISNSSGGGSGLKQGGQYVPFMKFSDNPVIGASKASDGSTNAYGTLYPTNVNNDNNLGAIQTYLTAQLNTNLTNIGLGVDDYYYTASQTKFKVAESYFNKYKRFIYSKVRHALRYNDPVSIFPSGSTSNAVCKIVGLDSTRFVLIYVSSSSTKLVASVGTIAAAGTITFGAEYNISTTNHGVTSSDRVNACLINTDKVAVIYYQTTTTEAMSVVISMSGNVITAGTEVSLSTGLLGTYKMGIFKSGTDAFIASYGSSSGTVLSIRAATVSGTTITYGTAGTVAGNIGHCVITKASASNKGLAFYDDRGGSGTVCPFSWSGTVVTMGTRTVLTGASTASNNGQLEAIEISADKWFVVGTSGSITPITTSVLVASYYTMGSNTGFTGSNYLIVPINAGVSYALYSNSRASIITIDQTTGLPSYTSGNVAAVAEQKLDPTGSATPVTSVVGSYLVTMNNTQSASGGPYAYYAVADASTVTLYSDAVSAGAFTPTLLMAYNQYVMEISASGKKAYLGVENTGSNTKYIQVGDVLMEVE